MKQHTSNAEFCESVSLGSSSTSLVTTQTNLVNNAKSAQSQTAHTNDILQLQKGDCLDSLIYHEHQLHGSPCSSTSWRADSMRSGNSSSSTVQQQSLEEYHNSEEESTSSDDSQLSNNIGNTSQIDSNSIVVRLKRYMSINAKKRSSNSVSNKGMRQQQLQATKATKKLPIDDSIEQLLNANRRQIQITTCAQIYNRWRLTKRLYHKAPKNGIQLEVDYIDTGITMAKHIGDKAPIVLALHGAPGSYTDYGLLIQHLAGQAIRVIAPNFPEYTATVKTKTLFRHSADEKASYLRDFLRAIHVNRIDLLISHSSAVFPSLLILLNDNYDYKQIDSKDIEQTQTDDEDISNNNKRRQDITTTLGSTATHQQTDPTRLTPSDYHIQIRALALFNPAGHRLPQSMKPTWFKCGSVRIYQNKFGRAFFQKFGSGFLTIVGVPVRVNNMDHVMLSATVMRNSECQRVVDQLNYLSQLRMPTLLVFSENDKLIEKDIFYEMTQFMGLDKNHFDVFDDQGKVEQAHSHKDDWIRVMVFKAGGHYAYSNYANTVNKAVTELLCKVCSCSDSESTSQDERNDITNTINGNGKQDLGLLLAESQFQANRQKKTIITNDGSMSNVRVKRHFKW